MSNNPLLQKIRLPGRIFQLPSRGLFYKNGELDESVKNGEIHVSLRYGKALKDKITLVDDYY